MRKMIRSLLMLAVAVSLAGAVSFAQSTGETTYKAKCVVCHGVDGLAHTSIGLAWKVKPVSDPSIAKMEMAEMLEITRNGRGKMQSFKDKLTDAEIKASVNYFRTLIK